ncbi:MAG: cell division topological specificity factor MinE [Anaerolineales bacterium]|nr:cell division topological specificity factor MinE [Anaerolineales bacterium]MCS7248112.1 cell division topological specificity factor MinE [Anaerolineales bacterium]MDW8161924.1 cell division topological specificity factor MinE [Anaerolineales bacterium]MDW8446156.1 cell division topological specificity factor MinE [Anaerolineales bacterium]
MAQIIDRILNRQPSSAHQAKERMRLILVHDRTNLSSEILEKLKDELIGVISRHIEVDEKGVRIEISQQGREQRLIADIPLRPATRRRLG